MVSGDIHDIVVTFIGYLTVALTVAIIVRALMSWFVPNDSTGISRVLGDITDPILTPIRRVLPPVGGIDFSPLLALILVQLVGSLVSQLVPLNV